ncbi:disease resistance protein RUN1-like [Macadamia integrifolia]|uniref:disease resistance protein RUN1-like n=1 Tax=Macadamia integrifolia TaxID=60698 RepID=UPI001C4E3253|nr:disease resistance protein RUN1-like [Macadamia integrifolia]
MLSYSCCTLTLVTKVLLCLFIFVCIKIIRHEAEVIIRKIVEEVLTIVNKTRFQVAAHPIGLDSHIEHLRCLLNDEMNAVRIIGIYGSGGIGKSTIAKAAFNDMFRNFEGSSFLANVRELSRPPKGLALLQRKLLSDILKRKDKDIDIDNEDEGINIIEKRLCCKRVLIVLDDVADMEQFDKLFRGHDCFGPGSRIILTTRDEHLLNRPEVDEKYAVKTMNQDESLELFSFHAFRRNHPFEDFVNLSNDVIQYAGGLPLALVILGSHLYQRNQDEWESELKKISKIPNRQILEKLKISYEALDDINQTIFLDISCFFIGKDKNFVITILDACGLEGKAGIILLRERSLITIDEDNRLRMHDMIRDMGREIVREQFPRKPGGRSRLWDNDDAIDVLVNLTGTDAVEGLQLDLYRYNVEEFGLLTIEGFSKMPNLRLLKIDIPESSINIDEEHSLQEGASCFRNLVWISWERFPFKCIPKNFHLRKLAVLDMQLSNLTEVWKETKNLTKLKDLNLSSSHYLTCTPDFSGLPNLEKLILSGCKSLVEVHESIGHLKKLINLDLGHCNNLNDIPSGISKLTSLETLDISYCPKLRELPEGIGNLKRLTMLDVRETAIRELPSSFGLLKNLTVFSHALRYGIRNSAVLVSVSFDGFCSLKQLTLENCNLTDDDIPDDFWMLYSLESLNLSGNYFESLPFGIGQLSALQTLNVGFCKRLQSLPMLPSSLRSLDASFCVKLKSLPNLSNLKHLLMLDLSRCKKLTEIEGLEGLKSAANIKLHMGVNLKSFAKEKIFQGTSINNVCDIFLAGDEVPKWFDFQSESFPLYCQAVNLITMR